MSAGPPTRRSGPLPTDRPSVEVTTTDRASVPCQLARRREASRRLARLAYCGADPWAADHRDWQDRHDLLMAKLGLAEPWQAERARQLWRDGAR